MVEKLTKRPLTCQIFSFFLNIDKFWNTFLMTYFRELEKSGKMSDQEITAFTQVLTIFQQVINREK